MKHTSKYKLFANGYKLEHTWHRSQVRFLKLNSLRRALEQ